MFTAPMLVGHREQQDQFLEALGSGRMHHAWILAGPRGVGKRRFADMAALRLLAGEGDGLFVDPDHPAARLVAAGSHLDHRVLVRETDDKGKQAVEIRVEQVRALQALFRTTPGMGGWRVVILDSIDDMNRSAANAFLKSLEEPPAQTLFLLVSHAPQRLLPTIRSRCRVLRFRRLADEDVRSVLAAEGVEATNETMALAAGAPGEGLRFAGEAASGLIDSVERVLRHGPAEIAGFARAFQPQGAQLRFEAMTILVPRRLATLALRNGGDRMLDLQQQAERIGRDAVMLAYDRVQVAFALGELLARAGRLQGTTPRS